MIRHSWNDWDSSWDQDRYSPYYHWRLSKGDYKKEETGDIDLSLDGIRKLEFVRQPLGAALGKQLNMLFDTQGNGTSTGIPTRVTNRIGSAYGEIKDTALLLPAGVRNNEFDPDTWMNQDHDLLPEPPPLDSVIVGVIDTGVALGHRRFQYKDGKTRILAAWQQNALARSGQPYLPFGEELYSRDIQRLLDAARPNGPNGPFDEDAFNRNAGLVGMRELDGHRELSFRAAHGTHVLDLAAGFDPDQTSADFLEKVPIIVANLPNRTVVGLSGSLLEYFVILGISRIAAIADQLWLKAMAQGQSREPGATEGYRILINLSFGKSAGSRDGRSLLHRFIVDLNTYRHSKSLHPVELIMPAGNDNLERQQARVRLESGGEHEIRWRIQPEDRSSNYLEIWSDRLKPQSGEQATKQLEIQVSPPGQPTLQFTAGEPGQMRELGNGVARVYCLQKKIEDVNSRVQYLICTSPTYSSEEDGKTAPAGVWHISVKNCAEDDKWVFFSVQTDQSAIPNSGAGRRSYFEASDYDVYDPKGRVIDSFSYKPGEKAKYLDTAATIKRHGSMNALATKKDHVLVVGGYRLSDGKPAPYSATGSGNRYFTDSKGAPTASMPTDDGPAHRGRLAAGSRNGSVVALQGTSFATAQATRMVVMARVNDPAKWHESANSIVWNDAHDGDREADTQVRVVDMEKVGGGRCRPPETGYPQRRDCPWTGQKRA